MTEVAAEERTNGVVQEEQQEGESQVLIGTLEEGPKAYAMPKDWTLDEMAIIERMTGQFLGEVEWVSRAALAALALIIKRREDPKFPESDLGSLTVRWAEPEEEEEAAGKVDPPHRSPADSGAQS